MEYWALVIPMLPVFLHDSLLYCNSVKVEKYCVKTTLPFSCLYCVRTRKEPRSSSRPESWFLKKAVFSPNKFGVPGGGNMKQGDT